MEQYITLEEAAEYESMSYETIKKRVQRNSADFSTKTIPNDSGGKERVLVSVESLSKNAQRIYKKQQSLGIDKMIVDKATEEIPWYVNVDIEWYINKYSKHYYKAVELSKAIQQFLDYRGNNRTDYANAVAGKLGIGQKTLYRLSNQYLDGSAWATKLSREDGANYDFFKVLALCRKPKQCNMFPSLIAEVKALIENIWFDKGFAANRGTIEMLYEKLGTICDEKGYEYPSYKTVARYVSYLMQDSKNAHFLAANGTREYKNKVMLKGTRDATSVPVMGLLQGDEHTFDCWVKFTHPNGKVVAVRPTLVLWMDTRSRVIGGEVVCIKANSQILKQSLIKVIYTMGVPEWLLIDNGRDYTAETMTGHNRKDRASFDSETKGFYKSIGIQDEFRALPYQAWVKSIERTFGTVCGKFTKWFDSYTGTLTGSKTSAKVKKDINKMLENDELLSMEEFLALFTKWKDEVYHKRIHSGLKAQKEKWQTPIEIFENCEDKYFKPAPPREYATMLMMKCERVRVNNFGIRKFGYEYRSVELASYIGQRLDIKWDPEDVTRIYVYDSDGRKLCEAVSQDLLLIAPRVKQKALEDHMQMQRRQLKQDREKAAYYTTPLEERIPTYDGHNDVIGKLDLTIKNDKPEKVVALVQDKQFMEELKEKKTKPKVIDNSFFTAQAESALEKLRKLG